MNRRDKIGQIYDKMYNAKAKTIDLPKLLAKDDIRKLLEKNQQYKNIHSGQRCFILGNGPSLKADNLSLLQKEYVFTVNQAARHEDFKSLNTNFHFWADPEFFNVDETKPEDRQLIDTMKAVNTSTNTPECFFPIEHKDFIHRYKIDEVLHVNYYAIGYVFYEGYNKDIDFTKLVPGFHTVVMSCVIMAIYMGFSEIYMLGIDNTGIITVINSALNNIDDSSYAYGVNEIEKKRMKTMLSRHTLEEHVAAYLKTLAQYRGLFQYCASRNIRLANCSSSTVIDSIPRISLENVLRGNS